MDNEKLKIVVWLKRDYSKADDFELPRDYTKEQITKEVNKRYDEWYYFDIW